MPSKGVKIFGSLAIFFGIIGILFGIVNIIGISQSPKWIEIVIPISKIKISIIFILYLLLLTGGIGTLILKNWSRKLIIGVSIAALWFYTFYGYHHEYFIVIKRVGKITMRPEIMGVAIFIGEPLYYIFNLWFFSRSGVKKQFQK